MKKLLLAAAVLVLMVAPFATATHSAPITEHRTYETALHNYGAVALAWTCPTGFVTGQVGEPDCDPTGTTQDGSIDLGGFVVTRDEDDATMDDISAVTISIVDDVWGPGVVSGSAGTDEDDDNIAGEEDEGEARVDFCGDSAPMDVSGAHSDWVAIAGFVWGGVKQALDCDITAASGGTSGGVLDPAAGVFVTFA